MRLLLATSLALLVHLAPARAGSAPGAARSWTPLRITLDCQGWSRTRACPFVQGFIDATPLLASVPRSDAQVVVYLNATEQANDDLVNLRFTATIAGAPSVYEVTQAVDSRTADDAQRAQLEPAFRRGVAVFLGVVNPQAVSVELAVPDETIKVAPATTPWGWAIAGGGGGMWSKSFQSLNGWSSVGVYRTTNTSQALADLSGSFSMTRQPPLVVDGEEIDLDYSSYEVTGRAAYEHHLGGAWSTGVLFRAGHQDAEGQFEATGRLHAGISRDWYPSDDPRGNQLAVAYLVGAQADRYNARNVLGERDAWFPSHMLLASGSVRKDTTTYGVHLSAAAELLEPTRRHVLSASVNTTFAIGAHVDLSFSFGVTRQAIPGRAAIDTGSIEQVTRSSYAEPLSANGFANVTLHWDATNGARNNRMSVAGYLQSLGNL